MKFDQINPSYISINYLGAAQSTKQHIHKRSNQSSTHDNVPKSFKENTSDQKSTKTTKIVCQSPSTGRYYESEIELPNTLPSKQIQGIACNIAVHSGLNSGDVNVDYECEENDDRNIYENELQTAYRNITSKRKNTSHGEETTYDKCRELSPSVSGQTSSKKKSKY